jgi:ppGpp synthetase/RelA/SpoT-type nucleotidyltranferase
MQRSLQIVVEFRTAHQNPMLKLFDFLKFHAAGTPRGRVSHRLKRMDRLVEKLGRHPMRLSQMEDVGGCRAVVPGLRELRLLSGLMLAVAETNDTIDLRSDDDYVTNPKPTGYRGRHLVFRVDGRSIEAQIRTSHQDRWAQAVEDALGRTGFNVKDAEGPEELLLYFERAAYRLDLEERGMDPEPAVEIEFARLRESVRQYFV